MEEKHERAVEEVRDMVRRFSKVDREGLDIKNWDGLWGGVPGNTKSKVEAERRKKMEGPRKRWRRNVKEGEKIVRVVGKRWSNNWRGGVGEGGRMRRRVKVIAEEDEGEENGESVKKELRRRRPQKKVEEEEEEEEESEEDEEEEEEEEWRGSEED